MEGETASRLFHEGGFLILLEVPQGTEIGIDYNSWNVGPKFKGIKMIPPGLHMIYYSSVSKDGRETGPRCSFFHFFKPKEILVRVWNPRDEELTEENVDQLLIDRLRENLYEMDNCLGPYPYEHLKKWLALTNYITPSLVER
ncbi:PREDICTED: protein AAR2 homolog [Amphimedon queenslandica]|uniref:Protein AAR2 homolog n=1 Tax=Amphimedon queenslandica TaxID=400682 RepID=A0AAN0J6J4_AMPQE|nr:PREDICTED: protein AAR2 homolog [Amphimedon queenslandica]|eukprot:XP_019852377.1 PREDICTED: protein AAR2 homolog [Amphimedon queenslandica]